MRNSQRIIERISESLDKTAEIQKLPSLTAEDFAEYIMPPCRRWEIAAQIIAEKGMNVAGTFVKELLVWLQDSNWPGYDTIFHVLTQVQLDQLVDGLRACLPLAGETKDEMWLEAMYHLMCTAGVTIDDLGDGSSYRAILAMRDHSMDDEKDGEQCDDAAANKGNCHPIWEMNREGRENLYKKYREILKNE